jgi:hypothetical protein
MSQVLARNSHIRMERAYEVRTDESQMERGKIEKVRKRKIECFGIG